MVLARTKCLFLLCSVLTVAIIVIFHNWSYSLIKKPKVKGLRETSSPEVRGLLNTLIQTAKGGLNTLQPKLKGPSVMTAIPNSSWTPKVTSVPRQLDTNKITVLKYNTTSKYCCLWRLELFRTNWNQSPNKFFNR